MKSDAIQNSMIPLRSSLNMFPYRWLTCICTLLRGINNSGSDWKIILIYFWYLLLWESPFEPSRISNAFLVFVCGVLYLIVRLEGFTHISIQVEPGKPGAEVSKKKNYKSKKEFAYRMCTGWPTTAMPKPFHGCGVLTCFDVVGCRVRSDILWLVSECG